MTIMSAVRKQEGRQRITLIQGEVHVSDLIHEEVTTVLGSCVATCLFDPRSRIGGINHFLLAEPKSGHGEVDVHYGIYLMEVLINEMLTRGAAKKRIKAHLYGGANLHVGMQRIGTANAQFARDFLAREHIELVQESLGGHQARRVDFRPASGLVRCRRVDEVKISETKPAVRPADASGDVELF